MIGGSQAAALRIERTSPRRLVPCDECPTPIAEVRSDCIVIKSRHHNQWHVTVISFDQLQQWIAEAQRAA